jgi:hypothetical protein
MEEQNDLELEEFCFRCSAKDPRYDAPAREPLHNPWPLLARSDQLEYTRSQPLVRMWYSPISFDAVFDTNERQKLTPATAAQSIAESRDDFITWFNALHEGGHLWCLDWTPAKELAKTYQAHIYTVIKHLLFDQRLRASRIERLWKRFDVYSGKLNEIAKNIGFVEELVATANAIAAMEVHTQSGRVWGGFQDELETCRVAALRQEAEVFSDFQATHDRFAPLMRLMYRDLALRSYVMPLLQPVRVPEAPGLPYAMNSRENLQMVLSLIEGIDSAEEVIQRLQPLNEESVAGWKVVLGLQIAGMQEPHEEDDPDDTIVQMLWRISRSDLVAGAVESVAEQATLMVEQVRNRIAAPQTGRLGPDFFAGLWPGTDKGQAFIGMKLRWFNTADRSAADTLIEEFLNVVFFEGLRQQLRKRKGIICPLSGFDHVLHCRCPERTYKAIKRLSKLAAKDEAFGPGEWALLPCKR